ncbi:hypothetical protein [Shinella sp. M27]|uniref:hypothetical protein n=1 Tax=Shinella sp. M27 TaxID=3368614 RepID=UPI003BA0CC84
MNDQKLPNDIRLKIYQCIPDVTERISAMRAAEDHMRYLISQGRHEDCALFLSDERRALDEMIEEQERAKRFGYVSALGPIIIAIVGLGLSGPWVG